MSPADGACIPSVLRVKCKMYVVVGQFDLLGILTAEQ
jgi:hypothetical protein